MSRVLFVALDEVAVTKRCLAARVGISTLERLPSGGTRLVCMSGDGAATMRRKLKNHLITTGVTRLPHRPKSPIW